MPALRKEFLDIQPTLECGLSLKPMRDMTRTYSEMHHTDKCSEESSMIWPIYPNGWAFVYQLSDSRFECSSIHFNFWFRACLEQAVLWQSSITECRITLKSVRDMARTYSQMHCAYKCAEESSMIWQVCRNGRAFDYQLSDSGFEGSCRHLNFRYCACFQLRVPWHLGNYRVWIHSEMRTWPDKNKQSNEPYG